MAVAPSKAPAPARDRRIVPASATANPESIQLINPAIALVADPKAEAAEPAIYFEASDLPSAKPAVVPAAP